MQRHQIQLEAHIIIIIMTVTPIKAVVATKGKDHSAKLKESVGDNELTRGLCLVLVGPSLS